MDGNGRWATQKDLPRVEGHRLGVEALTDILRTCVTERVPILSIFAFSSENWSRPPEEVSFLLNLFIETMEKKLDELCAEGVCIRFLGDRSALPQELQWIMDSAEQVTMQNKTLIVNVVLNYGGRWDILQATQKIARYVAEGHLKIDEINETLFSSLLSTHAVPDPDLLIRTSGELRISNFFLWQCAYTEFYFTNTLWPDFNASELRKALKEYAARKRRFGHSTEPELHHA